MVGKDEEMQVEKALEVEGWSKGEEFCSVIIPSKFAEFSGFLGLPMVGFEKEINAFFEENGVKKGTWG